MNESGSQGGPPRPSRESDRPSWASAGKAFADVGSVGIEMGLAVAVGYFFGTWLDDQFGTKPWLMYLFLVAGIGAAFKALLRVAKKTMAAAEREEAEELARSQAAGSQAAGSQAEPRQQAPHRPSPSAGERPSENPQDEKS